MYVYACSYSFGFRVGPDQTRSGTVTDWTPMRSIESPTPSWPPSLRPAENTAPRSLSQSECPGPAFRVQGSGFRVQGSGFRVRGAGFRVQGSGCRVQG